MVVAIGLVELEHGELGVVLGGDTLVAEVAVDLVDAVEAADDQALQIKLRRDAQLEVDIQRVVVRRKWPCRRPTRNRVHHRRLDFEVAARIEELAHRAQHRGPLHKNLAHIGIRKQVDVPLAVAQLGVFEAVELVG